MTVRPSPFRATVESPVSLKVIGLQEIGEEPRLELRRVAHRALLSRRPFSPVGYRNDLIVRGGGPAGEQILHGRIEIPNINHFATQGATGGR